MTHVLWRMTGCPLSLEMVRRKGREEEVQVDIVERVDPATDDIKGRNIARYTSPCLRRIYGYLERKGLASC